MAPKMVSAASASTSSTVVGPCHALEPSHECAEVDLVELCSMVASVSNEWGATIVRPGTAMRGDLSTSCYAFFIHSIYAGLVLPLSRFFTSILEHYQIQALHGGGAFGFPFSTFL
jgi:hypothetical protein